MIENDRFHTFLVLSFRLDGKQYNIFLSIQAQPIIPYSLVNMIFTLLTIWFSSIYSPLFSVFLKHCLLFFLSKFLNASFEGVGLNWIDCYVCQWTRPHPGKVPSVLEVKILLPALNFKVCGHCSTILHCESWHIDCPTAALFSWLGQSSQDQFQLHFCPVGFSCWVMDFQFLVG